MDLYCCIERSHDQPQLGALNTVIAASFDIDLCEDVLDFLVLGSGSAEAIKQDEAALLKSACRHFCTDAWINQKVSSF